MATRRPLLQIVVLFATDVRVYAFAKGVAQRFVDAGIDVFLNVRMRGAMVAISNFVASTIEICGAVHADGQQHVKARDL